MPFRSAVVRAATVAAVLSPFSCALFGHAFSDSSSRAPESRRQPLAFREYLVNLGRVPEGRPVPVRFVFANRGTTPLTILGAAPSCGCLVPRLEKRVFAPGEEGMMIVAADTAAASFAEQHSGNDTNNHNHTSTNDHNDNIDQVKEHYVDVQYDAGEGPRTARVNVKYILPARRVIVEPRALIVYQFSDQPTTREIVVTDRRTPPIDVTSVERHSELLGVTSDIDTSTSNPVRVRVALTIPPVKQNLRTFITIHTSDPEQPRIQVPIQVQVSSAHAADADRPAADAGGSINR